MSDVFAVELALDLSPVVPSVVLDDLRRHLGVLDRGNSMVEEMAGLEPLLAARGPAVRIGSLLTGDLVQCADRWSLAARQEVHAELLPELESLAERLVLHAKTEGLIGEVRFHEDEIPDLLLNRSGTLVRMALRPEEPADS